MIILAGETANVNGEAKVTIEKDMLKAHIEISGPLGSGEPCSMEQARKALNDKGVTYGIKEDVLQNALLKENWGYEVLVAEGRGAVNGADAKIIYKFPLPKERVGPKVDEQGNVDYHDLGLIHNVQKGVMLAERIAPEEGVPGIAVTGAELLAKRGKDFRLPRGKNTVADNEDRFLYAAVDGHVTLIDNKVVVDPVLQISGDVDFSTGDLDFVGNILISGKVNSGFKVKAEGDIEIRGSIEGADVIARGNIMVKGGITGGMKTLVMAGENIYTRFVENSRIEAGKDVITREAIIQSFVKAGGSIRVNDKKAIIVGGIMQAFQEVEAKVLGSPLATQTVVEVGVNPHYREEYQRLLKSKTEKKKLFDSLAHNLHLVQKSGVSSENLSESKRLTLVKMLDDFKNLRQELGEMDERILYLESEFERSSMSKVKVLETVYPGVRISIGQSMYIVNDAVKYAAFILDHGEIRLTSLR